MYCKLVVVKFLTKSLKDVQSTLFWHSCDFRDFNSRYYDAYSYTTKKDLAYIVCENHPADIEAPQTAIAIAARSAGAAVLLFKQFPHCSEGNSVKIPFYKHKEPQEVLRSYVYLHNLERNKDKLRSPRRSWKSPRPSALPVVACANCLVFIKCYPNVTPISKPNCKKQEAAHIKFQLAWWDSIKDEKNKQNIKVISNWLYFIF